jgi:hypothetical protein
MTMGVNTVARPAAGEGATLSRRANMYQRNYGGTVLQWEENGSETVPSGREWRVSTRGRRLGVEA